MSTIRFYVFVADCICIAVELVLKVPDFCVFAYYSHSNVEIAILFLYLGLPVYFIDLG